jgi:hypothetical protein
MVFATSFPLPRYLTAHAFPKSQRAGKGILKRGGDSWNGVLTGVVREAPRDTSDDLGYGGGHSKGAPRSPLMSRPIEERRV